MKSFSYLFSSIEGFFFHTDLLTAEQLHLCGKHSNAFTKNILRKHLNWYTKFPQMSELQSAVWPTEVLMPLLLHFTFDALGSLM